MVKGVKITLIFAKITHLLKGTINNLVETKIHLFLFPLNTCNFFSFASFIEWFLISERLLIFFFRNWKKNLIFFFYFIIFLWCIEQKTHISFRNLRKFIIYYSQNLENFTFSSSISFPILGKILIIFLSSYLMLYF